MQQKLLQRVNATQLRLSAEPSFPVRVFANESVPIERQAVDELLSVLDCQRTLDRQSSGRIEAVAITPDFHKGAGIPIGTVLQTRDVLFPQAIGNDINCGMRLHTTNIDAADLAARLPQWEPAARRVFFEGGRQIPMTAADRESLLSGGLSALFAAAPWSRHGGLWQTVAAQEWPAQLDHIERHGSLSCNVSEAFHDWLGQSRASSYDDQTGSIGGGNHFVEIQRVERILDRHTAYAWGLREGAVTVMIHSGSVGLGHIAGRWIRELVKSYYPSKIAHPENGIYPLAPDDPAFWNLLHNAANFAFANRLFLAAAAIASLESVLGPCHAPLVYDSPHNLVWPTADGAWLHRKGATPARGPEAMAGTPFQPWGEPVLVPGSMGASSFVLAGQGHAEALESASHGAGRALSRGDAMRTAKSEFDAFRAAFRIVTPLDLNRPDLRGRPDITTRKVEQLRAEGPHAYKGIRAIIDTLSAAGIARPVAELVPLATVKG
jgi:tRNA-splicing ligase RtcB